MHNGSIKVASIRGVPILAHWSLALIPALFTPGLSRVVGLAAAVITTAAFIATVLAHEIAHVMAARKYGVATTKIQLWALGGAAHLERQASTPRAEGWIAAAGPLTTLAISAVTIGGAFAARFAGWNTAGSCLLWLGVVNAGLGLFNLLPGSPLDGGRILKAVRWSRHGDRDRATREAARAGATLGWSIVAVGAAIAFNGGDGFMLIATGVFLAINAKAEEVGGRIAAGLRGTRIRELTLYGIAQASGDTNAATMLWHRSRIGLPKVVAINGVDGQPSGLVAEQQLWDVPEADREQVALSTLATPFNEMARAELDEDLADVLPRLNPARPFVTVWQAGRLVGVVRDETVRGRLQAAVPR